MAEKDLCAQALAIGDYVVGAFFVQAGSLVHWRMREGLKLPDSEKVSALAFQRTLIHGSPTKCRTLCQRRCGW